MKIIILGAGQVGGTLAENLSHEENDITVVDNNGQRLRELQDKIDIRTIHGMASHPSVLKQAGADGHNERPNTAKPPAENLYC